MGRLRGRPAASRDAAAALLLVFEIVSFLSGQAALRAIWSVPFAGFIIHECKPFPCFDTGFWRFNMTDRCRCEFPFSAPFAVPVVIPGQQVARRRYATPLNGRRAADEVSRERYPARSAARKRGLT